jgi:hypothetical protein
MKTIFLKIKLSLFAGLLLIGVGQNVQAQVTVSGSADADGSTYGNLGAAFTAITAADQTGKTILITLDQTSIVETATASLTNKGWSSLTIRPSVAGVTLSGEIAGALIKLDGVGFVTIDGRIGGTGSTKDLTISNTSTATIATQTIALLSDAKSNVIQYATIKGTNTAASSGTITITTGLIDGNDNNTIDNCDIADGATMPVCPIYIIGTSATISNDGIIISNNNIYNFTQTVASTTAAGIYIGTYVNSLTIDNNRIFWNTVMNPTIAANYYGAVIKGNLNVVKNNVVGYADANGNGVTSIPSNLVGTKFVGMQIVGGSSFEGITTVTNNKIGGIEIGSNSTGDANFGVISGFYTPVLAGSYIKYEGNTVNGIKLNYNGVRASNVYWTMCGLISMGANATVVDNTVCNLTQIGATPTNICMVRGISLGGGSATVYYTSDIIHNTIFNLAAADLTSTSTSNQAYGIQVATQSTINIERNNIYNVTAFCNSASSRTYGINSTQAHTTTTGITSIKNNMICLGNENTSGGEVYGIYQAAFASTAAHAYYFNNTVYIGGNVATGLVTGPTAAFYRLPTAGVTGFIDLKNNIFSNMRVGGTTGFHYAIRIVGTSDFYPSAYLTCDNNLYQSGSTASNRFGLVNTTPYSSFNDWKVACISFDSKSSVNNPQFVDPTSITAPNLHLRTDIGTPAKGAGEDLSNYVANDIDGELRLTGAFDAGADANPAFTIPVFKFGELAVPSDDKYLVGRNIDFLVSYTLPVVVTGTPSIPVTLNSGVVEAAYISGSGSTQLKFGFNVVAGQLDLDGITIPSTIALNGGSIKSEGGADADIALPSKTTSGILIDGNSAPSIVSVKLPADKKYPNATNLDFVVTYDNIVNVLGVPQLDLLVGDKNVAATFISGSGSKVLTFRYITLPGELDLDGINVSNTVTLNGATIQDVALNNALLNLPEMNTSGIIINAIGPKILSIEPCANGVYSPGTAFFFTLIASEPVILTGLPRIKVLSTDDIPVGVASAVCVSGSGTNKLLMRGTISTTTPFSAGVKMDTIMSIVDGNVKNIDGNSIELKVPTSIFPGLIINPAIVPVAPTVVTIPAAGKYTEGQDIIFKVGYSFPVEVVGNPSIMIYLTGSNKYVDAYYVSGTATDTLTFSYKVAAGDKDLDGISIIVESTLTTIHPNAGSIKEAGTDNIAKVAFTAPTGLANVIVDAPPAAVNELKANELTVYSANKTIFVKGDVSSNSTASIYDICGRIVTKQILSEGAINSINAGSLKGMYIVSINNNGKRSVSKVIVK